MLNWFRKKSSKDKEGKGSERDFSSTKHSSGSAESLDGFYYKFLTLCEEFDVSIDRNPFLYNCSSSLSAFDLDSSRKELVDSYLKNYNKWNDQISTFPNSHPDLLTLKKLSASLAEFNQQISRHNKP